MMTQDHEVWTDDLDRLLLALLDQPPPREEGRARGAVSLAALATQERNRAAAARRDWPALLRRPGWRVRIAAGITVVAVAGGLALAVADTPYLTGATLSKPPSLPSVQSLGGERVWPSPCAADIRLVNR